MHFVAVVTDFTKQPENERAVPVVRNFRIELSLIKKWPFPTNPKVSQRQARQLQRVPVESVAVDSSFMLEAATHARSARYLFVKRAIDLIVAAVIGAIAVPLFPIVALAIIIDSRGPVIYRQMRVGLNGQPFTICKFRTMAEDAEAGGAVYASMNDPRITRLGRFLRRTRIDELPQMWNILRGDMSLIGPRPERPENIEMLEAAIPCFSLRTTIRPGLTGWAQVSSVNYAATIEETARKVEYDFYYLARIGPLLDLRIACRTIAVILRFRGR